MMTIGRWFAKVLTSALLVFLAITVSGCQENGEQAYGDPPENLGFLRSGTPRLGKLLIFDADTFEIYRSVDMPIAWEAYSHRLEIDPMGRVWIGYAQDGMNHFGRKSGVQVLSAKGSLERELDLDCAPPDGGIAFAEGYAFVGCAASGFSGQISVVDLASLEVVKTLDEVHPPGEKVSETGFYITTVAEAGGAILVVGFGSPPRDYPRVTNHSAAYTRVGVIDPETLGFRGWLTDFEPGLRVFDVLEIDGKAWLFNELSHLEERAARTDVYIVDPVRLKVIDRLNLGHPFPTWASLGDDGVVYILHRVKFDHLHAAGYRSGITKLDLATGEETFVEIPRRFSFKDLDVYQGMVCMANRTLNGSVDDGLWCLEEAGGLEFRISQDQATGIMFLESSGS